MKEPSEGQAASFWRVGWKNSACEIAAFTVSGSPSGDKLNTLTSLAIFAAQHGMLWIGTGQNAPISGEQLGEVLGGDALGDLASRLGLPAGDAAAQLAQVLPGLVDRLTPQGVEPEGGLGNAADLLGQLGGFFQK